MQLRKHGLLLIAFVSVGCASTSTFESTARPRIEPSGTPSDGTIPCIMEVMGTGLRFEERDDGIAMVFETVSAEHVGELREAVGGLARAYEGTMGSVQYGRRYRGELKSPSEMGLPALRASVEPVEAGARLVLRAQRPEDVQALQQRIGAQASAMQRGACPLFTPPQAAQPQPTPPQPTPPQQ